MLVLLSPAKSLNFETTDIQISSSPIFEEQTLKLVRIMSRKSKKELKKLMSISDNIAKLNVDRYKNFHAQDQKQALLAFNGDVYQGFDAGSLQERDLIYADQHLRILSGLYGLLRPLDLIKPYRLEMGIRIKYRSKANLYQIWGDQIKNQIEKEVSEANYEAIINLASKEYFKSVNAHKIKTPIYEINFRELRNDKYIFVSFNAKKARGIMARYIVDHKIKSPNELLKFDRDGYKYEAGLSTERQFTYIRS